MTLPADTPAVPANPIPTTLLEPIVRTALAEDLGRGGDITSTACIPADARSTLHLRARETGVLSGAALATLTWHLIDPDVHITWHRHDADALAPGDVVATISGPTRALLTGERVALNFLGHLSGIASATARMVAECAGTPARIADTRKTTPGLRIVEKLAVRHGGGMNHRMGLDDAVMLKDNHLALAGGLRPALTAVRAQVGHLVAVEVEVDTLEQLHELIQVGQTLARSADVVLLDNMSLPQLREAVAYVRQHAAGMVIEASGNVRVETVRSIAETGVDVISAGFITHSAPCLDLGLDVVDSPAESAAETARNSSEN